MKTLEPRYKNIFYLGYRLVAPVIDPIRVVKGFYGYFGYVSDLVKFQKLNRKRLRFIDLYPIMNERTNYTSFDAHYFYQQLWLFEKVMQNKPNEHIDVGSTYQMSGYLSKITNTTFVDIRPIDVRLPNLKVIDADIANLPFSDGSIKSLSCLHVLEHVGLGRYGGKIDPEGTRNACKELSRVLSINGLLYISLPIGKDRVCFNAHKVTDPESVMDLFNDLKLISFSVVDDTGTMKENVKCRPFKDLSYGLGMYIFTKK
jgi:hypothetical protein